MEEDSRNDPTSTAQPEEHPQQPRSRQRGISPGRGLRRLEVKLRGLLVKVAGMRSRGQDPDVIIQAALVHHPRVHMIRSGSLIRPHETLSPVREGPAVSEVESGNMSTKRQGSFRNWIEKTTLPLIGYKHSDIRLLLGVIGAPLSPIAASSRSLEHMVHPRDGPIESTSAQYILHQYLAASGGYNFLKTIDSWYSTGKLRMSLTDFETANKIVRTKNPFRPSESGSFLLWHMKPDMWSFELVLGSAKVFAGSDGRLAWRDNPWTGPHPAKGPIRPLRRVLQGLDPLTTVSVFTGAVCIGEKEFKGEDCFVLKVAADADTLAARSDGPTEFIRHYLFGYFSQRTGLLLRIEDSLLTKTDASIGEAVYWETSMESTLEDYRNVDGLVIAHSGHSATIVYRFGEVAMGYTKTRMLEDWTIEEMALNVKGLSEDFFIPPAEIRRSRASGRKLESEKGTEMKREHQQYAARVKAAALESQRNMEG